MGRYLVWALGLAAFILLSAAPAAAQVDIGVWTPNGGGRVVLGAPRVYSPPPVYAYPPPRVYVVPRDYYYRPFPGRGWAYGRLRNQARFASPYYYGYPPYPGRAYRTYGHPRYPGPGFRGDAYSRGGGRYRRR